MGKNQSRQQMNCCEHAFFGIFKHLIHIFILVIIGSFLAMIYMVQEHGIYGHLTDADQLESNIDQ